MRNKHPGICYRCNKPVAIGEGHFERARYFNPKYPNSYPNAPKWRPGAPKWHTQHASCAIEHRGTDVGRVSARKQGEQRS